MSRRLVKAATATAVAAVITIAYMGPADAGNAVLTPANQIAAQVQAATGTSDIIPASQTSYDADSAVISKVVDRTVDVPKDPSVDVTLITSGGQRISIGIANGRTAQEGKTTVGGTTVYTNPTTGTASAVQVTTYGLREIFTLSNRLSNTTFLMPLRVPNGYKLELNPDGSAQVVNVSDRQESVAFFDKPWARDASAASVNTWYSIDGSNLIQHVQPAKDAAFPIVADSSLQADCGWATCTIRLDQATTRNAREAGWLIATSAALCSPIGGVGAAVCGFAVGFSAVEIAVFAGRYYEAGNCIQLKVTKSWPPAWWPGSVRRGTRNCR
jgi:hypothetical protein